MPYDYTQGRFVHRFPNINRMTDLERNAITFARTRSGKGVTQIIPTLRSWYNHNFLVIDPKGEAVNETVEFRTHGAKQNVIVLDPMKASNVDAANRAKYNPLAEIDPTKAIAFRQINAIADGLVMRHDPKGEHWEGGGVEVLAGYIAHVLTAPEFQGRRSLPTVRSLLKKTGKEFGAIVDAMAQNSACGGLAQTAASKLMNTGSEAAHFLSVATSNTKWLDDPDIVECMSETTFKMGDFKRSKMDIFLVLPMDALGNYGNFLRLFVRLALHHMQQPMTNGDLKGRDTVFILDEFYSLGYIGEIAKALGGLPGFNLHLWPFLQDLNQLWELYGKEGAGTFLANCDRQYFYGVNDPETADFVSNGAGGIQEHELMVKPPTKPEIEIPKRANFVAQFLGLETERQRSYRLAYEPPNPDSWMFTHSLVQDHHRARAVVGDNQANHEAAYQDAMNLYSHARACIGHPRVSASEVMQITKKNPDRDIIDFALVLQEGVCYREFMIGYFEGGESFQRTLDAIYPMPVEVPSLFEKIRALLPV